MLLQHVQRINKLGLRSVKEERASTSSYKIIEGGEKEKSVMYQIHKNEMPELR